MEKNPDNIDESKLKLRTRQVLTALSPLLGIVMAGLSSGYSAVLLPQLNSAYYLTEENSTNLEHLDEIVVSTIHEESWIASSAIMSMAPGCWMSGLLLEKLGRRWCTVLVFPVISSGWIIIGIANNIMCLLIGRLISGFCAGYLGPLTAVYISETSDPVLRGVLLSMINVALSSGILIVHALGAWLHWRIIAYICSTFSIIGCLTCIASRESPTWLINKGFTDQARDTWVYLRGLKSLDEYQTLEDSKVLEEKVSEQSAWSKLKITLSSRHFLWPLGVLCLYFFTSHLSGYNAIIFYSVNMLIEVAGPENAYVGTVIIDAIRLATSVVTCYIVNKCYRRTLTFVSGFGTAYTMLLLSSSLYFDIGRFWLPGLSLVAYTVFLTMGLFHLPWMLCGELFPRNFRGIGSGFTSSFGFICTFVLVKMTPGMFVTLQSYGTFAIFGVVSLLGTTSLYFVLPETKDKTLQEIEKAFDRKSKRSNIEMTEQKLDA